MTGIFELKPGVMTLERVALIVPVVDAPTRPWRNGNGCTTILHTHAPRSRTGPLWTLSLAALDGTADFSTFAGYDRHFMIVGHDTVELDIDGRRRSVAYTQVAQFPGEANVRVDTRNRTSLALNLMVERSDHLGNLSSGHIDDEQVVDPRRVDALVLLSGVLHVEGTRLDSLGDTVILGDRPIVVRGASAIVARIELHRRDIEGSGL